MANKKVPTIVNRNGKFIIGGEFWESYPGEDFKKMLNENDYVKVVRCKDCEYFSPGMPDEPILCELTMCGANDEGFCAWAERREDAKTD